MRDAKTEALLNAVDASARAAVAAGCNPESVVWEATAGAFASSEDGSWVNPEARRRADSARHAVQPTQPNQVGINPKETDLREIPRWAVTALVDGKFYRRALVPDCWVPEGPGPTLSPREVQEANRVAFYAKEADRG